MSTRSLTYQQSVFTRCDNSDKHFSEFLLTRWRQKSSGIDTEQNYVTVSLFILLTTKCLNQQHYCCMCICPFVPPPTVQCGVSHALFIPNIFWGGFFPPKKNLQFPPKQPFGKLCGLNLFSTGTTVTLATLKRASTSIAAWRTEARWV